VQFAPGLGDADNGLGQVGIGKAGGLEPGSPRQAPVAGVAQAARAAGEGVAHGTYLDHEGKRGASPIPTRGKKGWPQKSTRRHKKRVPKGGCVVGLLVLPFLCLFVPYCGHSSASPPACRRCQVVLASRHTSRFALTSGGELP